MPLDPLSPIAPARVRVLLLPVGRIKRSRFQTFVARVEPHFLVRLGDISPDIRSDRNMFSPVAFPNGMVIYDFATHVPAPSHLALSPFELFREPLMILGLADGTEYASIDPTELGHEVMEEDKYMGQDGSFSMDNLFREMDLLREQNPKVLAHKLLIFDKKPVSSIPPLMPDGVTFVPPIEQLKTTTMKTIVCDITATFLAELTAYARSIQALSTIDSPSIVEGSPPAWLNQSNNNIGLDNARAGTVSRSSSGTFEKRMSLPTQLPSSTSDRPANGKGSRPGTPQDNAQGRLISDHETGTAAYGRPNGEIGLLGAAARSSAAVEARDASRDKFALQGFGSGSISERNRNRGKGRIGIVIGTFYLLAGRWNDALRELVENTNRVRAFSDHIWYAKGVENILVCLLLCAWKGIDFEVSLISSVISPYAEKAPSQKPTPHTTTTTSIPKAPTSHDPSIGAARSASVKLSELLPDSLNMIMSIYERDTPDISEALPENAFSEVTIRIAKLFATLHIFGGVLTHDALDALICCKPLESFAPNPSSRLFIRPLRQDIAEMVFKALPPGHTAMAIGDRITALAGVASVLSMLGLQRKKALVIKEFLAVFSPLLIDARKAGAAELGIHPAAGLSALSMIGSLSALGQKSAAPSEHGFKELLVAVGEVYGVQVRHLFHVAGHRGDELAVDGVHETDGASGPRRDVKSESSAAYAEEAVTRSFGSLQLKYDILRTGLSFCEALPDFDGVLQLSATMLRIAGPTGVPNGNSSNNTALLAKEEQVRLMTNIPRTLGAAKTLGLCGLKVNYWDEFLVRDIQFIETPTPLQTISHPKSELEIGLKEQATIPVGPFIYDPSSKATIANVAETVLVARDQSRFALVLQNPFEFEVDIESLKLAGDGVELTSSGEQLTLGPFRTQLAVMTAVAVQPGQLKVTGCTIKVRGCYERNFAIFNKPWVPHPDVKVKSMGLLAAKPSSEHPEKQGLSSKDRTFLDLPGPEPSILSMTVVPEQPLLKIASVSLVQSSIMILEGERQVFTVTLENIAAQTSVDLLLVSFQDSTIAPIQAAMKNKDLPRQELYELELQHSRNQAFRLQQPERLQGIMIEPGQSVSFDFEVLGKPGLSDGVIQFDYAHLGIPHSEVKDRFFTRKISLPLSITVNASVMFQRLDLVPFSSEFAWSNHQRLEANSLEASNTQARHPESQPNRFSALLDRVGRDGSASDHCLALLDLRNAWPNPITVSIDVLGLPSGPSHTASSSLSPTEWTRSYTIHEYLYPGHTTRLLMLLPRIYLTDPYASIPILDEKNKRQFVRSQGQPNPNAERDMRERFWYREELLKRIRARWKEEPSTGGRGREGDSDLRGARLSRPMLEALRLGDVDISISVVPEDVDTEDVSTERVMKRLGRSSFALRVEEFVVLRARLRNCSNAPVQLVLRLLPTLAGQSPSTALDLDRKLVWTGLLQQILPTLSAGTAMEVDLGLCALCVGDFEIGALVEETQNVQKVSPAEGEAHKGHGRRRSGMDAVGEESLKERGRRAWSAVEPCRIFAREAL
ncbi:MAG: hypothetical protein Q9165_000023 [Trypethelium subeluteriae]